MRLEKGQTIGGFPAIAVRDWMRKSDYFDTDYVGEVFGLSESAAQKFLKALVREGFIRISERPGVYEITEDGLRLRNASAGPLISRDKADKLLQGLIERAKTINASPEFTQAVVVMVVFGSYLDPEKDKLGDLDVAVEILRKPGISVEEEREHIIRDMENGAPVPGGIAYMFWPYKKAIGYLKSRKAGISLHPYSMHKEMISKGPFKVIDLG